MKHGGDLSEAQQGIGVGRDDWLDLSTGINPAAYPFTPPAPESWTRLPQSGALAQLLDAARSAYGVHESAGICAAPGTQILIQLLPLLIPAGKVAIVGPTYSEHAICWRAGGAEIVELAELSCPSDCCVVLAVNPNNPDGRIWTPDRLRDCAVQMASRGGVLIVDEAFADVCPEVSATPCAGMDGLLLLRSFGKFFGLAGVRLGFAVGPAKMTARLEKMLGPWAVSGPAMAIGRQALRDLDWQRNARAACIGKANDLDAVLIRAGFQIIGGTPLYRLAHHGRAAAIHADLAREGIWVRRFDNQPDWLRFGLPAGATALARLAAALYRCNDASSFQI